MTIDTEEARITALSDADLLAEYMAGDGEPGDTVCDLLAGELERRGIDL